MTRILIADPDMASRKALALLLTRKFGIDCIDEASDTGALIRCMAENPPDLLLLNWTLQGTPGPETCRLLRKTYPHLKIVLLSPDLEDAGAAHAAGAEFLFKGAPADEALAVLTPLVRQAKKTGSPDPDDRPSR